jgi:hypothetical protein
MKRRLKRKKTIPNMSLISMSLKGLRLRTRTNKNLKI